MIHAGCSTRQSAQDTQDTHLDIHTHNGEPDSDSHTEKSRDGAGSKQLRLKFTCRTYSRSNRLDLVCMLRLVCVRVRVPVRESDVMHESLGSNLILIHIGQFELGWCNSMFKHNNNNNNHNHREKTSFEKGRTLNCGQKCFRKFWCPDSALLSWQHNCLE